MNIVNLVIACILGAVGLALAVVLIWLPLSRVVFLLRSGRETTRFKRAAARIQRADELMDAGDYVTALQELRRATIFDVVHSRPLINAIREHHQNILSRMLIVSEQTGGQADNIAQVDHLITQRSELQALYLKAFESFHKLSRSRESSGKAMPAWSKGEFDKKVSDIRRELTENQRELEVEIEKLFSGVKSPTSPSITYH